MKTGIKTEEPPQPDEAMRVDTQRLQEEILRVFGSALTIRHVDAGSCNGCELEIHSVNNAYYNIEGLGIKFVASPRHADMLLVTGPVSRHMEVALKRTYDATPEPKLVVAIGECACDGGIFLRRKLCELRQGFQRHSGGRGGKRLSARAHRDNAGHTHCDQFEEINFTSAWKCAASKQSTVIDASMNLNL